MDDIVRCDIHLVDLSEFKLVNEIYAGYFQAPYPARVTVASASLPKGARVEVAAIATI
jgi:enamine deaminase RidA (YjgF/YER057c/UK114 family)